MWGWCGGLGCAVVGGCAPGVQGAGVRLSWFAVWRFEALWGRGWHVGALWA